MKPCTGLKPTAFARTDRKEAWTVSKLQRRSAPARKEGLKMKGPRMTPIRRAARGQDCTLQLVGICNRDPAAMVLCHSTYLADEKGMGLKAPHTAAGFGCTACHDVLDGRRPRPEKFSRLDLTYLTPPTFRAQRSGSPTVANSGAEPRLDARATKQRLTSLCSTGLSPN